MAHYEVKAERDHDLTCITLFGKLTPADIISALKAFYESEFTSKILWDFSNSDVSGLVTDDFSILNDAAKVYAHLRPNGKTALFGPDDLTFGLCRMYAALANIHGYPIEYGVFKSMEAARDWLMS